MKGQVRNTGTVQYLDCTVFLHWRNKCCTLYSTVMQMSKIVYLASEYSVQFLFNIAIFQKGYTMTLRWYPIPQKIPRRGLCPQYLQYSTAQKLLFIHFFLCPLLQYIYCSTNSVVHVLQQLPPQYSILQLQQCNSSIQCSSSNNTMHPSILQYRVAQKES